MHKLKKHSKRIAIDTLGYSCLIIAPLISWLPGPGGIPLLLAGLSLLSINNHWAKRLLELAKLHQERLAEVVFPKNKKYQMLWDLTAISLLIGAIAIFVIKPEPSYKQYLGYIFLSGALGIFLFNRQRINKLTDKRKHQ